MARRTLRIERELEEAAKRFVHACMQVKRLNAHIRILQLRYDRAKRDNQRSFRYILRLRLTTAEGVRNVFYEYAHESGAQVEEIQARFRRYHYPDL